MNKVKLFASLPVALLCLSGCTHKMELVSQKDQSVYNGEINSFTFSYKVNIKNEIFEGTWSKIKSTSDEDTYFNYTSSSYGKNSVRTSGSAFTDTTTTHGGILKGIGSNGGYLVCQFTLNNSVEYGECKERKSQETFDLKID